MSYYLVTRQSISEKTLYVEAEDEDQANTIANTSDDWYQNFEAELHDQSSEEVSEEEYLSETEA